MIEGVGLRDVWQRAETSSGIPYYINHDTETTQWDHPAMTQLLTDLSGANDIKYAAYRTAVKLRGIEKRTYLYCVDLNTVRSSFNDLGHPEKFTENEIDVQSLEKILSEMFSRQNSKDGNVSVADGVEITLNWILNVYDTTRNGSLRILSAKIGLACLSVASVQEKYKYMFDQISSSKGYVDKKRLRILLQDALQILRYIKEYNSFARGGIEGAVQSCFERAFIPERISLQEFLDWMVDEPQTLVWLPTLHRLAMSETVKHEGKCNICKMFPIVGFRYRCLKCFNFDMCQDCFWSGRVSKNHKLSHQTQEYCLPATQKEDIKDFAKVFKSKVRKKKRKKKKKAPPTGRFLPITNDGVVEASDEERKLAIRRMKLRNSVDNVDNTGDESTTSFETHLTSERFSETEETNKEIEPTSSRILRPRPVMDDEHQLISYYISCLNGNPNPPTSTPIQTLVRLEQNQVKEMDEIVNNLELDNRYLREKLLDIQDENARESVIESEIKLQVEDDNERLVARQEVLEDHNRRLEHQLAKLQLLIEQKKHTPCEKKIAMPRRTYPAQNMEITEVPFIQDSIPLRGGLLGHESLQQFPRTPLYKDVLEYSSKQNSTFSSQPSTLLNSSWGSQKKQYSRTSSNNYVTLNSTSSDEDLRVIGERLEQLLETERIKSEPRGNSDLESRKFDDSGSTSVSDEQQSLLLTAASMVGEAVESFVSSLSRGKNARKYIDRDIIDDEEV